MPKNDDEGDKKLSVVEGLAVAVAIVVLGFAVGYTLSTIECRLCGMRVVRDQFLRHLKEEHSRDEDVGHFLKHLEERDFGGMEECESCRAIAHHGRLETNLKKRYFTRL